MPKVVGDAGALKKNLSYKKYILSHAFRKLKPAPHDVHLAPDGPRHRM